MAEWSFVWVDAVHMRESAHFVYHILFAQATYLNNIMQKVPIGLHRIQRGYHRGPAVVWSGESNISCH